MWSDCDEEDVRSSWIFSKPSVRNSGLAGAREAEGDWPRVWQDVVLHFCPSPAHGRDKSGTQTALAGALALREREEISRGPVAGQSIRAPAGTVGRAASTVIWEVRRNGGRGRYRAAAADRRAWKQALRLKPRKLVLNGHLRQAVALKLQRHGSLEQIAGWLNGTHVT